MPRSPLEAYSELEKIQKEQYQKRNFTHKEHIPTKQVVGVCIPSDHKLTISIASETIEFVGKIHFIPFFTVAAKSTVPVILSPSSLCESFVQLWLIWKKEDES